jgi:hypothetical protein
VEQRCGETAPRLDFVDAADFDRRVLPGKMTHRVDRRPQTRESTEREFIYGGVI